MRKPNPSKSPEERDKDEARLDVSATDTAIRSKAFWGYLLMLDGLLEVVELLTHWCEGCQCHWSHSHWNQGIQGSQRWSAARQEHQERISCPLAGLRAPQLASGEFVELLHELLREANSKLLLKDEVLQLSGEEKAVLMTDYARAKKFLCFNIMSKVGHYHQLPWVLLGLGHRQPTKAHQCAKRALDLWRSDSTTPAARSHALCQTFLSEGSAERQQLEAFVAAGASRAKLIDYPALHGLASRSCFVMVTERWIESRHAISSRFLRTAPHATATHLPFHIVMSELRAMLRDASRENRAKIMMKLADAAQSVHSLPLALQQCGLWMHPTLERELVHLKKREVGRSLRPLVTQIFFHSDAATLHQSLPHLPAPAPIMNIAPALNIGKVDMPTSGGGLYNTLLCKYALQHLEGASKQRVKAAGHPPSANPDGPLHAEASFRELVIQSVNL